MTFSRQATVNWQGSLMDGSGDLEAGTGAFSVPVSFPRRVGEPEGVTSPEELIASAHATCFAMVVAGALAKKGATTRRTVVTCTISADKTEAGIKIARSRLDVVAEGLSGLDGPAFEQMAKEAEGRCPVSNALRNSLAIEVHAKTA
jgi:osmotically inducible protein OsmC